MKKKDIALWKEILKEFHTFNTLISTVQLSTPWTPQSSSSTIFWFDPTQGITDTAGAVDAWSPVVGSIDAIQSPGGNQPSTGSTYNSLNVITFDGNDSLNADNYTFTVKDFCVVIAFRVDSLDSTSDTVFSLWNGSGSDAFEFRFNTLGDTTEINFNANSMGSGTGYTATDAIIDASNFCILTATGDFTTGELKMYFNGNDVTPGGVGNYSNDIDDTLDVKIFVNRTGSQSPAGIAGDYIYSTDLTDREKMEGYLAHKWGLTSSLPALHPYKSSAPTV